MGMDLRSLNSEGVCLSVPGSARNMRISIGWMRVGMSSGYGRSSGPEESYWKDNARKSSLYRVDITQFMLALNVLALAFRNNGEEKHRRYPNVQSNKAA